MYFNTFWIRVFMIFYLIVVDLDSFSYRRLSIVKRLCRFSRRRDINKNIHEKTSDFTILFDCLRSRAKWLRKCWRDWQKDDTSLWKKIVFYKKYRELASRSCQTKDSWNAWSQFEFWEVINFGFWYTDIHTVKLTSASITLTSASQIKNEFFVKQKFLHHCCTRNAFEVLQHKSFVDLLSWWSAFDLYKYNLKRAIFDVDHQVWKKSFLKLFRFWCSSTSER